MTSGCEFKWAPEQNQNGNIQFNLTADQWDRAGSDQYAKRRNKSSSPQEISYTTWERVNLTMTSL